MLCLAWFLSANWRKQSKMTIPVDRIMDRAAMERVDALLTEVSTDPVRETSRLLGENRRRRSSSRVHYRRNVRRILSDCRRAKR